MKTLIIALCCLFTTSVFSQNITNTLGVNGLYSIKDAANSYLILNQSNGQVSLLKSLRLENTTSSTTGVIYKGSESFLHNFGAYNTFLGVNSGNFTMTGSHNTAMGYQTLNLNTTGIGNTAIGFQSLNNITTVNNITAVGNQSLYSNTSGYDNTAMGNQSMYSNTSGYYSTAVGFQTLFTNTSGYNNSVNGYQSLFANTTGYQNSAIGYQSLFTNTTGYSNSVIGFMAGSTITTGFNNICIGNNSQPTSGTISNSITIGNNMIDALRSNVTSITSLSDARDKKNIANLTLGLDFIAKLIPRQFNWDKREWYDGNISDGSKMTETPTAGFIAQELDEIQTSENAEWLNLVLKDNPEKFEATPGNLLPVIVKAIQELKTENDKLKKELESLKGIEARLAGRLEQMILELNIIKEVKLTEK